MASSLPSLLHGRHLSPSSSLRLQLSHCSLTPAAGNPVPPRHLLDANTAGHTEPPWRPSLLPLLLPPAGRPISPPLPFFFPAPYTTASRGQWSFPWSRAPLLQPGRDISLGPSSGSELADVHGAAPLLSLPQRPLLPPLTDPQLGFSPRPWHGALAAGCAGLSPPTTPSALVVDAALRALPVRRNVEPCGQSMRLNPDSFRTER
uniref:Uncharacterized protein n=1 Tax=Zea mays TaxID=4577 RepID=A0A804UDC5_MAIZE